MGSGVGSADADVAEPACVAEGDAAGFVDDVAADAGVGVGGAGRRDGPRAGQDAFGRLRGSGTTRPRVARYRLIVAADTVTSCWCCRCPAIVSGPTSRP